MRIELKDHLAGARAARGTAVIIDVFRACSTLACAFAGGAARVSLVRMGHEARERCIEDDLYAHRLIDLLEGRDPGLHRVPALLREAPAARKFFDPAFEDAPQGDFAICTDIDRNDFVLRRRQQPGAPCELERLDPPWPAVECG